MLREVYEKEAKQNERRRACAMLLDCFRREIEYRYRQHEAG
jgi:hypothetical protein